MDVEELRIKERLYQALEALENNNTWLMADIIEALDEDTHPDRISIKWGVEDVFSVIEGITDEEARQVLSAVESGHDCNYGISWDTVTDTALVMFPHAKEV